MKYLNQAAICVALFLCSLCSLTFAQSPFGYDSIQMSFGYVIPDYRKSPGPDSTNTDFLILCPVIYKKGIDPRAIDVYSYLDSLPKPGQFYVGQLPRNFIDSCMVDNPGDTLLLMGSFGQALATVSEIDYMEQGDVLRTQCQLKLINPKMPISGLGIFIALRNHRSYSGPVITYHESKPVNNSLSAILDSTKTYHLQSWIANHSAALNKKAADELIKHALDSGYVELTIYQIQQNSANDALLIIANLGDKMQDVWSSVYQIHKIGARWNIKPALSVSTHGRIMEIDCAFDLNNDGRLEYLVKELDEQPLSLIYTATDSGWVKVVSGDATWGE